MDDDDFDELDLEEECSMHSYPWSWRSFGVFTLALIEGVANTVSEFAGNVAVSLAAAHNHAINQRDFAAQVARDIETIDTLEE